jgi:hypothetical protein
MKAILIAFALWASFSTAGGQTQLLTTRIYDYAEVSESVLEGAKEQAQGLLRAAGVETTWIDCPPGENRRQPWHSACTTPFGAADIILRILPESMASLHGAKALGYALPLERTPTLAYVLYDRLQERVRITGVSDFRLLGHVIAHEIAHLLLASERHARSGLMMSYWGEKDLVDIDRGLMHFSKDEARMLQAGATARMRNAGQVYASSRPGGF